MTIASRASKALFISAWAAATLASVPETAWSQARVLKVSGNKAIVEFPVDAPPQVGQRVYLSQTRSARGARGGPRDYVTGIAVDASLLKDSRASGTDTRILLTGRFGWNLEMFEYGPIAKLGYTNDGVSSSSRELAGGGFFDYNLLPNDGREESIYGLVVEGTYGILTNTTMSVENSTSTMELFAGGFLKWFLGPAVCARTDAGFDFVSKNETSGASTQTGAKARVGLQVYF